VRIQYKYAINESLTPEEEIKRDVLATLFIYSHEILLHLYQTGQVDETLWDNIMDNNQRYLASEMMLPVLKARSGRLGRDLLSIVEARLNDE
jgi:hypothetical protein